MTSTASPIPRLATIFGAPVSVGTVLVVTVLVVTAWLLGGCAPAEEAEPEPAAPPPGPRVESEELGVAIAAVPGVFEVVSSEGAIELRPLDKQGRLTVDSEEPVEGGVNLVARLEAHQSEIESRSGGVYQGQRELVLPLGTTTYYSRGRWDGDDGRRMEESVVFALHPEGDRVLRAVYVYPAGDDSPQRLQDELFALAGELEAAPSSAAPSEPSPSETSPDPASSL